MHIIPLLPPKYKYIYFSSSFFLSRVHPSTHRRPFCLCTVDYRHNSCDFFCLIFQKQQKTNRKFFFYEFLSVVSFSQKSENYVDIESPSDGMYVKDKSDDDIFLLSTRLYSLISHYSHSIFFFLISLIFR